MASYVYNPLPVFTRVLDKAQTQNKLIDYSKKSIVWLRKEAQNISATASSIIKSDATRFRDSSKLMIGQMYLFAYDAKWKDKLPYWDMFPLIVPFESTRAAGKAGNVDGFMGLNFHYLHPMLRAKLMDGLYDIINNPKLDESTRLKLSYTMLKGMSKLKMFKPCVKKYLFSQLKSRFIWIDPREWDMALMLPIQKFVSDGKKYSAEAVWKDSRSAI